MEATLYTTYLEKSLNIFVLERGLQVTSMIKLSIVLRTNFVVIWNISWLIALTFVKRVSSLITWVLKSGPSKARVPLSVQSMSHLIRGVADWLALAKVVWLLKLLLWKVTSWVIGLRVLQITDIIEFQTVVKLLVGSRTATICHLKLIKYQIGLIG